MLKSFQCLIEPTLTDLIPFSLAGPSWNDSMWAHKVPSSGSIYHSRFDEFKAWIFSKFLIELFASTATRVLRPVSFKGTL